MEPSVHIPMAGSGTATLSNSGSERNKDMGGLLMKGGRDFLIHHTAASDPEHCVHWLYDARLYCSVQWSDQVHRIQKPWLEIKDLVTTSWQYDASSFYFQFLRIPGQPTLKPQQMYFETKKSLTARADLKTWQVYTETMQKDCSVPCEQISPLDGTNINAQHDAVLDSYDLCDMCGIDGNGWPIARCGCCLDKQHETVACLTCIPKDHVAWIKADEDRHHWRCRRCRLKGLLPVQGCLFEDAGGASASESGVLAPAPIETHVTSTGVICLSDNDQDVPAASEGAAQSVPQSLQAGMHPRSRQGPMQPTTPMSPPRRQTKRAKHGTTEPSQQDQASPATLLPTAAPPAAANAVAAAPMSAAMPVHQPASAMPPTSQPATGHQALPASFHELARVVNQGLKAAAQLTEKHVKQLTTTFGDIQMLMDLLRMPRSSFNDVLRDNIRLDPMQIVKIRCECNKSATQ